MFELDSMTIVLQLYLMVSDHIPKICGITTVILELDGSSEGTKIKRLIARQCGETPTVYDRRQLIGR